MLNKRTNILFDEELWKKLLAVSSARDVSVGEVVREAVREKYTSSERDKSIADAYDSILKLRKKYKKVDYKALINEGRNF